MGEPSTPDRRQDPDESQSQGEQDPLDRLSRILYGRRVRFYIIVLVAFVWLLAECTHRSRHTKAVEMLPEFNGTTFSTSASSATGTEFI